MSGAAGDSARDGYRLRTPDWRVRAEDVRCRLVSRSQRVPDGVLAEAPVVTTYTLLIDGDADLTPTRDRVARITDRTGRLIEPGPFFIGGRLVRTGAAGSRSHTSYQLELRGGRHAPEGT